MLKAQIKSVLNALKTVKIHKIEDKDYRNEVIKLHFYLLGQAKKFDSAIEDLRKVHLGPYEAEIEEINAKQMELQKETDAAKRQAIVDEINSHADLLEAINGFNKGVADLEKEELEFEPLDSEKFLEEYQKQEYLPEVMEALMPIFKI